MISRNQPKAKRKLLTADVQQARESLTRKGWSYRAACVALGCSYTHLAHTLTGRRASRRLLSAIAALPANHAKRTPAA